MLKTKKWSYWEQKSYINEIDLIVIGAGIVGYSTALFYKKRHPKSKILILERGILPSGASTKNAGFTCFGSPTEIYDDLQHFDEKLVWETVADRWEGLQKLRSLIGDQNLQYKQKGSWDLITSKELPIAHKIRPLLDSYNQQLEKITGEKEVYKEDKEVAKKFGFKGIVTSFYNRLEGQIDTAEMNKAFFKKVIASDIHVLFGVEAQQITDNIVHTTIGNFRSKSIAICTNGFARQFIPEEDVSPARAQVLITEPIPDLKISGTFHYQFGYYYFRNIDNRILLGGGRNLDKIGETTTKMETTNRIMNKLEYLLKETIIPNQPIKIEHQWAGIMGVGKSKKPIIKKINNNVYCGVRLGGMGVAIGTLVGEELSKIIAN